jgi:hypothetical protein
MGTPTTPQKRLLAAGAVKAGTWGDAVAVGEDFGILIKNDGGLAKKAALLAAKEADTPMVMEGDLGPIEAVDFAPEFDMRYNPGMIGMLIAMLFGTAGTPVAQFLIDVTNNKIDFDEGGAELTGTVASGQYSGADLATAIAAAMNAAEGKTLTYTCTFSTVTRKFTIGAGTNFTIRWNTGTHKATDISDVCGYSDAANDTGSSSYDSDNVVGNAWKHTFQWSNTISGLMATLVVERVGKIWEVPSCKPMALDLTIAGGILTGKLSLRGNTIVDDSLVNTETEVDALTYADRENRVKFVQGTVKMNGQGEGDVAEEDSLRVSNLTVKFSRPMDAVHVIGDPLIIEPMDGEHPAATITINFPRMSTENDAYFQTFTGETEQKMLIEFTGPLIELGLYYKLSLYFPRLRIVDVDNPFDDIVPASITLEAEAAAAAPTGMDYMRPYLELLNAYNTDYLG